MQSLTLHDLATSRATLGIECDHCIRRALLTPELVKAKLGDKRTLREAGVRCGKCRSRNFTVTRFETRGAAQRFMRNV